MHTPWKIDNPQGGKGMHSYREDPCGCLHQYGAPDTWQREPREFTSCPLHRAAPALLEALEEIEQLATLVNDSIPIGRIARAAIDQASTPDSSER